MLTQAMQDALNEQINMELRAHYEYLGIAVYFEQSNYSGFARWMKAQSREEYGHAMKLYNIVMAEGGTVVLKDIPASKTDYDSVRHAFEEALEREVDVTRRVHEMYELAQQEKCYGVRVELEWFITEQVEEEQQVRDVLAKLEMIKDHPAGLLQYDHVMGQRQS
jgi:ferritin